LRCDQPRFYRRKNSIAHSDVEKNRWLELKSTPNLATEIEKCAHEADWYAEHGPKIMADEPAPTGTVNAYVSYLPLGPILAIMPWNFPIWQLTRMAIPTMLTGNVVLVKHSPNTQRSSLEFERVMLEAGFPEGVASEKIFPISVEMTFASCALFFLKMFPSSVKSWARL